MGHQCHTRVWCCRNKQTRMCGSLCCAVQELRREDRYPARALLRPLPVYPPGVRMNLSTNQWSVPVAALPCWSQLELRALALITGCSYPKVIKVLIFEIKRQAGGITSPGFTHPTLVSKANRDRSHQRADSRSHPPLF